MNTEELAEKIAELLSENGVDIIDEPEMDMRSGGHFIDAIDEDGEQFTILITRGY